MTTISTMQITADIPSTSTTSSVPTQDNLPKHYLVVSERDFVNVKQSLGLNDEAYYTVRTEVRSWVSRYCDTSKSYRKQSILAMAKVVDLVKNSYEPFKNHDRGEFLARELIKQVIQNRRNYMSSKDSRAIKRAAKRRFILSENTSEETNKTPVFVCEKSGTSAVARDEQVPSFTTRQPTEQLTNRPLSRITRASELARKLQDA